MAIFDARSATQLFNAADPRNVAFSAHVASSPTTYVWATTGHDLIHVHGTGITTGAGRRPTGGTATSVAIDLNRDGDIDANITRISVPLSALVASANSFWQTLLGGHDTIYAASNFGSVLFGDFLEVLGTSFVIGGRDSIVGGTGPGQNLYGDAQTVGNDPGGGGDIGKLTGGRDTIVARNTSGNSLIVGDARNVESGSELRGNADILTGSDSRGDTIIGDAERVFDSTASGANDTINGRGGDDLLIGDFKMHLRFPGATSGPSTAGGHDLINGGAGADTIIGDYMTVSNHDIGAPSFASGGNDRLNGNDGNDIIYGDGVEANEAFTRFGADHIDGGAGDDTLYGDAANANDSFMNFAPDRINGGAGNDVIYGDVADANDAPVPFGSDEIDGGAGDDTIYGDAGILPTATQPGNAATGGRDLIHGGAGDDTIDGGIADDRIFGDAGSDLIIGGFHDDEMTGGADADTFRFLVGSRADRILDFEDDIDRLEISSAYGYADAHAVVATATVSGTDITLHLTADDTITLIDFGTDPDALRDDIFIV
jgi:hypothetical protein